MASLTVATMTSPMPAYRRPEPPSTRMHKISLAPVLSATFSRDSCWIMFLRLSPSDFSCCGVWGGSPSWGSTGAEPPLFGLLDDLDQPPALGRAERAGLHHAYAVPDAGAVGLVVHLQPGRVPQHLAPAALDGGLRGVDLIHNVTHAFTSSASTRSGSSVMPRSRSVSTV